MAAPAGIEYIQKGFDIKTLNKYLDWLNLLTYDYHSAFEPAVNHHSPLYPLEEPNEYSVDDELNIDYTVKFYIENGVDREKLVLGIPTYGRSYTLFNPDAYELGSPADGPGEQGDATREKGYLAYYEICEALMPKEKKKRIDSDEDSEEEDEIEEEPWTVMKPNSNAMGPVAYKGNQWVGYDDIDIVKKKADYVAENGLGGIMFWSIDTDDFRGTCHGKPYPLIEAAKEAYVARLSSKDNEVVSKKPETPTRSSLGSGRKRPRPKPSARTTSTTTTSTTTTTTPASRAKQRISSAINRFRNNNRRGPSTTEATTVSTTPKWNATPEPPSTPDPGTDFKCEEEGFFPHPRDCKKYFWCLDSGPSNLGIVAHQFTCPSGLFFNKGADSCDFARNVLCKVTTTTTAKPTTTTTTTTARPLRISNRNSVLFRTPKTTTTTSTTTTTTTTTTPEPEPVEEILEEIVGEKTEVDAEDPKVLKDLIDLIKKLGGVEQLERHLLGETSSARVDETEMTTQSYSQKLYQVLQRTQGKTTLGNIFETTTQNNRGPQNEGLEPNEEDDKYLKKDKPRYTTINRTRPPTATTPEDIIDSNEDEVDEPEELPVGRAADPEPRFGSSTKPLQYVNIRRAKPTVITPEAEDDTASRNALFERAESYLPVSDSFNSLDIVSARRENLPEYVTIRRQRPTTEEATTMQYENAVQEDEVVASPLVIETSSPSSLLQYATIARTRATTSTYTEISDPEPTTVLAVQISSLLNTPKPIETQPEIPEPTLPITIDISEPTSISTTPSSTTTTATVSSAATTLPSRRLVTRRRGSTTPSTTQTPTPTTEAPKERPRTFSRRTKATAPPEIQASTEPIGTQETVTRKPFGRGQNRFKVRNELAQSGTGKKDIVETLDSTKKNETENGTRRPSLSGGVEARSERPRNFNRRKFGGANGSTTPTSTAAPAAPAATTTASRRPGRITSRRRLPAVTSTTTTIAPTTTTTASPTTTTSASPTTTTAEPTTVNFIVQESHEDVEDNESIEFTTLSASDAPKANKIQRRPLTSLKDDATDQNPSASNDDERKRQSKKYSSTAKKNQVNEELKTRSRNKEQAEETTERRTTILDLNSETAVAIAAHQLLAAPIPVVPNYEEDNTLAKSTYIPTTPDFQSTRTQQTTRKIPVTLFSEDFSSTPIYRTTSQDYAQTSTESVYMPSLSDFTVKSYSPSSYDTPEYFTFPSTRLSSSEFDLSKKSPSAKNAISSSRNSFTYPNTETYSLSSPDYNVPKTSFSGGVLPKSTLTTVDFEYPTEKTYDTTVYEAPKSKSYARPSNQRLIPDYSTSKDSASKSSPYINEFIYPTTEESEMTTTNYYPKTSSFNVARTATYSATSSPKESTDYIAPKSSPSGFTLSSSSRLTTPESYSVSNFGLTSDYNVPVSSESTKLSTPSISNVGSTGVSQNPRASSSRYLSTTENYRDPSLEPSYFPKDYSLDLPTVTTLDDQYQNLSPITKKPLRTTVHRKISTTNTVPNTEPPATTPKPRRTSTKRPLEVGESPTTPTLSTYDYYDDVEDKVVQKYFEGTKVVVHASGTIECLDMGNFPHPSSCKKFIQCARMEGGAMIGWEYICPKGLSFDPVGGICNWSAGLGCDERGVTFSAHPKPEDFSKVVFE